jgi:glycine cleavage system H lipoate-binding protein
VTKINEEINPDEPSVLNESPEEDGWLYEAKLENGEADLEDLMDREAYLKFTESM